MSKTATKARENIWCKARYEASKFNDRLRSREGAAEETGIDRTRLARIELGSTVPYPEEVLLMADIYHAPELKNLYCREACPLGCNLPKLELEDLDRISVRALSAMRKVAGAKEKLLDIVEDGVITDDEKPDLEKILKTLDEVSAIAQSLKVWAEKNLK